jgi:hypothetical protein
VAEKNNVTILIAPLDWGLGHATRCVPVIHYLHQQGCKVVIATEGMQEKLLKAEFPFLEFVRLPGYGIKYTSRKRFFSLKIITQLPKILLAVNKEKKWLNNYLKDNQYAAIISDNRYGLYSSTVRSVFITHQLFIKAPFSLIEKIIQRLNYRMINRFSECWVPDYASGKSLAGILSHPAALPKVPVHYLGGLSRLSAESEQVKKFDLLIIISGPEPQRTILEKQLFAELEHFEGTVLFIRGLPGKESFLPDLPKVTVRSHLSAKELSEAFNTGEVIISRSGYTTVMDICKLKKKSILIPTPGQTEQEYLAIHLQKQGWCVAATQQNFSLPELLQKVATFNWCLPDMNMDFYKEKLDVFVDQLTAPVFRKDT